MTEGIIAITGHRVYPDRAALWRGLNTMRARQYYFGGARGVDTDALIHIGKTQPSSIRTVVVPDRVINQPASARAAIGKYSTNVIELRNSGPDRFMIRNRFMVDHSDRVAAYYDFRGRGGTFNTIEYARQTGKPFTVFPMYEYDVEQFYKMSEKDFHEWLNTLKSFNVNLSSVKGLIIDVIQQVYGAEVSDFLARLPTPGYKTLEEFWFR